MFVRFLLISFSAFSAAKETPNLFEEPIGRELLRPLLKRFPTKLNIMQIPALAREDFQILRTWIRKYQQGPSRIIFEDARRKLYSDQQLTGQIYRKTKANQKLIDELVDINPNTPIEDIRMDLVDSLRTMYRARGLFERATELEFDNFRELFFTEKINSPKGLTASAMKLLMIYYYLAVSGQQKLSHVQAMQLNLLYPAKVPAKLVQGFVSLSPVECQMAMLSEDCKVLYYPNNGYVFGGAISAEGLTRGLDCSSFGAFMSGMGKQISTMALSYASRIQTCSEEDQSFFQKDDPDHNKRRRFFWRYGLKKAIDTYHPVQAKKPSDLKIGDLVIARGKDGVGGHYMINLGTDISGDYADAQWFYGLEMTRGVTRGKEEIAVRKMKFRDPSKRYFYLRPRIIGSSRDLSLNKCF